MERNMGPKQQPKKYLDSSKNIGGSLVKRRKGREEFSDNELISDSEDDQDDQDEQEVYFYNRHEAGNYEVKRAQPLEREAVKDDDIAGPKKKVPPKSLAEQIFTPVFMYQLYITITSVLLVNFCSVYILNNSILVSDTSFRSNDKVIDIGRKVQKALDTEMNKADIGGKVQKALDIEMVEANVGGKIQKAIHIELQNADIDSKVQDVIDIKLPDALNNQVPQIVRDEAESAVKGPDMKRVIETQVSENSEGIKSDVEQSLSSRIANAFGISLDKKVDTLEESIGGIAEFKESLASFEQKQEKTEEDVSNLHNNFESASESLKQLSESYSAMSTTRKHDSVKIDKLQTTIQNGEQKLIDMDAELGKVKKAVSYEEYKYKVLQLDDIRSRIDVIQPNMFNKGCFVTAYMILIVMVLLLAVSEYNLYQRLNNDIPGRTGGRTTAKRTTCSHVFFI
ncbi:uncharacterized protein LOC123560120 isoform X1 [Mercenaria mercenaria]|uniref:uncharacterized protein LOC123560120 isoform X1 n=1 Tax=Mercenaria mercenaria TaxID=6596 RepID=UPI00234F408D|nr:uncharacterized protein LOC123560120 isoform X1 [Mercenaria mercenaria]